MQKSKSSVEWKEGVLEPIAYYSVFWNEGIPMKIGIYLPAERYRRFPRIPFEWSIDHLQDIYKKLASGDDLSLGTKFTRASKQIANFAKPKLQNITLWNEGAL
ncbi:unnamed protein product [Lepeophtheirus salmonis]|uniref:(salmon louse) hypothetical protein n=1 Tax=Lepeophtheirus salmonis TaxID=72036 RepID=A0A7R8CM12_LEPSM|nr:unnamed protein product [Lepeophtheirus salmonis]CAF2861266.1 unnamed protein product [Lepeophtheirus salmonis]